MFFGLDGKKIDKVIQSLSEAGYTLTREEAGTNVFQFLWVDLKKEENSITLSQLGLNRKILKTVDMAECNPRNTLCLQTPLVTNTERASFAKKWEYSSALQMLMYLCANAYPKIQFAVYQFARFTHCPRKSHV